MNKYTSLLAFSFFALVFFFAGFAPHADADHVRPTVSKEAGLGALSGATVEAKCPGGAYENLGTTDGSGVVSTVPGVTADCQASEAVDVRITLDGYVQKEVLSAIASYSVGDFNDVAITVQFSHKLTITSAAAHGGFAVTGATVTNNLGGTAEVFSEDGTTGVYYGAVPIANDNATITISKAGWTTNTGTTSGNRAANTDAQQAQTNATLAYIALGSLASSAGSSTSRVVTWDVSADTADFSSYEIYHRESTGVTNANGTLYGSSQDTALGTRTTTTATVSPLSCDRTYYFTMYALDAKGNRTAAATEMSAATNGCALPSVPDTTPPSNSSVVINSGAEKTASRTVSLDLSVTDGSWVEVSEDSALAGAVQVKFTGGTGAMTLSFTLSEGEGTKTVYARFMDEAGNFSDIVSDTIVLGAGEVVPPPEEQPPSGEVTPSSSTISDGDLLRAANTVEVYVTKKVGATVVIRHIVNPRVFDVYGHFGGVQAWTQVKGVDALGSARVSAWVRGSDGKVWEVNADGTRHHMQMTWDEFAARVAAGDSSLATNLIFEVNDAELSLYDSGVDVLP